MPAAAKRQGGVALLTVLLIVALATVLTVGMISAQQMSLRRAGSLFSQDQAYLYALGAEDFIKELIRNDSEEDRKASGGRDHLGEAWAKPFPPFPVEGGVIVARLEDACSRFNLNSLVQGGSINQPAVDYFQRLLRTQNLPEGLAYAVVDWIDADSEAQNSEGAEEDFYLRGERPYRAANQPLASISELRLIRGFTPEIVAALAPFVEVLPSTAKLNINTMGAVQMQALVQGLSSSGGEELLRNRPREGYKSLDDFINEPAFNGLDAPAKTQLKGLLDIKTLYFVLLADAQIDSRHSVLRSVLRRDDSDKLLVISRDLSQKFTAVLPPLQNQETTQSTSDSSAGL